MRRGTRAQVVERHGLGGGDRRPRLPRRLTGQRGQDQSRAEQVLDRRAQASVRPPLAGAITPTTPPARAAAAATADALRRQPAITTAPSSSASAQMDAPLGEASTSCVPDGMFVSDAGDSEYGRSRDVDACPSASAPGTPSAAGYRHIDGGGEERTSTTTSASTAGASALAPADPQSKRRLVSADALPRRHAIDGSERRPAGTFAGRVRFACCRTIRRPAAPYSGREHNHDRYGGDSHENANGHAGSDGGRSGAGRRLRLIVRHRRQRWRNAQHDGAELAELSAGDQRAGHHTGMTLYTLSAETGGHFICTKS